MEKNINKKQKAIKIRVVGDSGSGKSTLLQKLIQSHSENKKQSYNSSIFKGMIKLRDGRSCNLNIFDILDNDNWEANCDDDSTDVLLLTYCVDQDVSYNNLFLRCNALKKKKISGKFHSKVLIVGTKADRGKFREVPQGSGEKLVKKFDLDGSIECSALSGYNVNKLFEETIKLALQKHNEDCEQGGTDGGSGTSENNESQRTHDTQNDINQTVVYVDNGQLCPCCTIV